MNLSAFLIATQLISAGPKPPVLGCGELPLIMLGFQQQHYSRQPLSDELTRRTAEQFVKLLDPSKVLLLEADVKTLERALPSVFDSMRAGRCPALDQAIDLAIQRAREDEALVKRLLGDRYVLDENVELTLDPDLRARARTTEERAALVTRMVHFQVSNFLLGKMDLEKAKKQLVHRYGLTVKRLEARKAQGELPELYAEAFAAALDPHSSFLSAKNLADFQVQMRLSLEGIGASLRSEDGMTVIESLVPGGQADKQNVLRPKDRIMAVKQDGEEPVSVIDLDLQDVVGMIRGKKGTKVTLTVLREAPETRTFDVTIVRDKIDVKEQAAKSSYQTRKVGARTLKVAVIDLPSFYGGEEGGRSAYADVKRLLEEAVREKVDGVVLDLSRNGGGLLQDAVRISGLFIKEGGVVATRDSSGRVEVLADEDPAVVYDGPLVVAISPASASASEILAGALKDYRRAVVVGSEASFGKGTVQSLSPLPGGLGALKVTTGMFFLPKGASTQQRGVTADVIVPSILASWDLGEAKLDYSLPPQSTAPFVSSRANGTAPGERWAALDDALIARLGAQSKARVGKDQAMQAIVQEVAENRAKPKTVKLAEMRRKAAKERSGDDEDARKKFDAQGEAFVAEAVNVAVDLAQGVGPRGGHAGR